MTNATAATTPRKATKKKAKKKAKTSAKAAPRKAKTKAKKTAKAKTKAKGENITSTANGNSKNVQVQFFKDNKGEHRWRLVKRGRIIGGSTEGYKRSGGAKDNFKGLREAMGLINL